MSDQPHNLGLLRKNVEDGLVAYLTSYCGDATVRAAFTTARIEHPLVVVHALTTREMNEDDYRLARYVDVQIRVVNYAEPEDGDVKLVAARDAHFQLINNVYYALAQSDIIAQLQAVTQQGVDFWSCYAKTDGGDSSDSTYLSIIEVEIGATPKEISG